MRRRLLLIFVTALVLEAAYLHLESGIITSSDLAFTDEWQCRGAEEEVYPMFRPRIPGMPDFRLDPETRIGVCRSLWTRARPAGGMLIVVPSNTAYQRMAESCYCSLHRAGRGSTSVLMSLDAPSQEHFTALGFPAFPNPAGMGASGEAAQRDSKRVVVTQLKLRGVYTLLRWKLVVLCTEPDVVYLRDPVPPAKASLGDRAIAFQAEAPKLRNDSCATATRDEEAHRAQYGLQCMGIYVARDNRVSRYLFEEGDAQTLLRSVKAMRRIGGYQRTYLHEQFGVNAATRMAGWVWGEIGELDRCVFAHGTDYFDRKLPQSKGISPAAVHAVGTKAKERALRSVPGGRWGERCAPLSLHLPNQQSWVPRPFALEDQPFFAVWALVFSSPAVPPDKLESARRSYSVKRLWKKLQKEEARRRRTNTLCHPSDLDCYRLHSNITDPSEASHPVPLPFVSSSSSSSYSSSSSSSN